MIRLLLFLLVIGLVLVVVARVMGVWRGEPKKLPPPDNYTSNEDPANNDNQSGNQSDSDSDDDSGSGGSSGGGY